MPSENVAARVAREVPGVDLIVYGHSHKEMADTTIVFKNAVKEIVAQSGRSATFMAKPHFHDGGSSCHIHSSLWADGGTRSVMEGGDEHHMSEQFRWYLGGLLATAREFSLLFAPNVNIYKRFLPGSWAPTGPVP